MTASIKRRWYIYIGLALIVMCLVGVIVAPNFTSAADTPTTMVSRARQLHQEMVSAGASEAVANDAALRQFMYENLVAEQADAGNTFDPEALDQLMEHPALKEALEERDLGEAQDSGQDAQETNGIVYDFLPDEEYVDLLSVGTLERNLSGTHPGDHWMSGAHTDIFIANWILSNSNLLDPPEPYTRLSFRSLCYLDLHDFESSHNYNFGPKFLSDVWTSGAYWATEVRNKIDACGADLAMASLAYGETIHYGPYEGATVMDHDQLGEPGPVELAGWSSYSPENYHGAMALLRMLGAGDDRIPGMMDFSQGYDHTTSPVFGTLFGEQEPKQLMLSAPWLDYQGEPAGNSSHMNANAVSMSAWTARLSGDDPATSDTVEITAVAYITSTQELRIAGHVGIDSIYPYVGMLVDTPDGLQLGVASAYGRDYILPPPIGGSIPPFGSSNPYGYGKNFLVIIPNVTSAPVPDANGMVEVTIEVDGANAYVAEAPYGWRSSLQLPFMANNYDPYATPTPGPYPAPQP